MNNVTKITLNLNKAIDSLVNDISNTNLDKSTLTKSKLALSLTLINMAIKSIPRLINLFEFSQKAEEKIFTIDRINDTPSTDQLIELYKLSVDRQGTTIGFISSVLNSVRWSDLESALLTLINLSNPNDSTDTELSDVSKEVINRIMELKKNNLINSK